MEKFSYHIEELKLYIKIIAIYLRKSRGDKDVDLEKHQEALIRYAKQLGVQYVIYKEIGSSDSIEHRPVFKGLLEEVREGAYDAVLVMKTDRLSRGDWADVATYRQAFKSSNTLVLTPHKVYDYSNEKEELVNDLEALVARQEYITIKERFRDGKINGLYLKQWINGPAPFPYIYNSETKGLIVNKKELPIYEMIKQDYINGLSVEAIAIKLNNLGILTRRKNTWSGVQVDRILFNEVHLGRIIHGKTTGSGHKKKKTQPLIHHPREKWIVIENCHQAVKTPDEHKQMLLIRESRQKVAKASRAGAFVLSGILYCGKCGHALRTNRKNTKNSEANYTIKCQKKDPYGHQCGNPGIKTKVIINAIEKELIKYLENVSNDILNSNSQDKISSIIQIKEQAKEEATKKIEKINNGFAGGLYNLQEAKKLKLKQEEIINKVNIEIAEFQENQYEYQDISVDEKKRRIEDVLTNLYNPKIEVSELNRLLRLIIDRVTYTRVGNAVEIDIKFL